MPLIIEIAPQIEARLQSAAQANGVSMEAEIGRRLFLPTSIDSEGESLEDNNEFPIFEETEWGHRTHFGIKITQPKANRMSDGQHLAQFVLVIAPVGLIGYIIDQNISNRPIKIVLIMVVLIISTLLSVILMDWWRKRLKQTDEQD